ncbi:PE-PPE domain-containing protein [Streptomyces sp. SP17BM10]|uniref:PE-PPE domain-containing protein n=1 Tax=Streptomyces sp. SP17BM10 TaxID=3002530 RepID=UPI002E7768ED|nr:PE-PPE domain-containing protein [Streptomyces sp. SP17BM10]MEE1781772.1 PE-PPE domain-containing protein [Streptomyces sp. SP17BM10]
MTMRASLARRLKAVLATTALALTGAAVVPTAAHADTAQPHHYYIEIGGTGTALDAPRCTYTFDLANQHLAAGSTAIPVCYPASGGPFVGSHNEMPAPLFTPSFGDSVNAGYWNAKAALENAYKADPTARFTIAGYSQGAWVGDLLLQTIANNGTAVPREQVDGMLYSDPMQPGTGFWHLVPQGTLIPFVAYSPGTGPENFPGGVPVRRFCIKTDGVCDATSLDSFSGFLAQHPRYPATIINETLSATGGNGTTWYPAGA